MNTYEMKQEKRRERLYHLANQAEEQALTASVEGNRLLAIIPPGQPIHVGHYSEKADRALRARINDKFARSVSLSQKAEDLREKVETVGRGGISSDDPDAVIKLEKKLAQAIEVLEKAKEENKLARKADRDALKALGNSEREIDDLIRFRGHGPVIMGNKRANVKRIEERIAHLKKLAQRNDVEKVFDGFTYREDIAENRIMFIFESKPDDKARDILKGKAFKWSPNRGAWVRKLSNSALWAARDVIVKLSPS